MSSVWKVWAKIDPKVTWRLEGVIGLCSYLFWWNGALPYPHLNKSLIWYESRSKLGEDFNFRGNTTNIYFMMPSLWNTDPLSGFRVLSWKLQYSSRNDFMSIWYYCCVVSRWPRFSLWRFLQASVWFSSLIPSISPMCWCDLGGGL